jgi:hypothetical protein
MAYIYNLSDAWNDAGTTFTAIKMNVLDTASNAASLLMDLQTGGVSRFNIGKSGQITVVDGSNTVPTIRGTDTDSGIYFSGNNIRFSMDGTNAYTFEGGGNTNIRSTGVVRWSSTGDPIGSIDLILARDAANTLAQRNGTNAQTFRVYNTFTDASNYERGGMQWSGGAFQVGVLGTAGTGSPTRSLQFVVNNGAHVWNFSTAGNFLAAADNAYDIGASGAKRPRSIYAAADIRAQNNTSGFYLGASADVAILRDEANALALRRTTNPQTFRVYNTSTDASNYERGFMRWNTNVLQIGTEKAGTGTARQLELQTDGTTRLTINTSGNTTLTGALVVGSDLYINGLATVALRGSSSGVALIANTSFADFTRLQLGGTTNSFGAIARDGAGVSFVGAAGGSTAHIKVPGVTVANLPAAATAGAGARSFVTDALTPVFGSAVTGGGAVAVPVYSTGSAWNVG